MRKVLFFMMISLDGYYEGPNGDIFWHQVDDEFNDFAIEQLDTVDTLLFGRVTYEMMASYWPTQQARLDDPDVAAKMNDLAKIVFSNTLASADWENTRLVPGEAAEELEKLRQQPGKNLIIFGSSDLAASLARRGLIDEFRIMVNPILLGRGKSLFEGLAEQVRLELIDTRKIPERQCPADLPARRGVMACLLVSRTRVPGARM